MSSYALVLRIGQGDFTRDITPEDLGDRNRLDDIHGPVQERLSHAHHSAEMFIEHLDEFARELHPDFVAYYWARILEHATRRANQCLESQKTAPPDTTSP